ncbi:hypothetical protein [Streptomyces sp. NPDC097610]|uniref:MmyB family transcriptional regulator n=1 Tax=Streptomyces sp. NPDC097610 TaxID=3157227 RepID=UPI00331B575A
MVFVDPAGREFYQEWERAAHSCAAEIRAAYGHDPDMAAEPKHAQATVPAADLAAKERERGT